MDPMNTSPKGMRAMWPRQLIVIGFIAMLIGAVDPMEGSLAILPGTGLIALGFFLDHGDRRLIAFRVWMSVLVAVGVTALWGISSMGGLGGDAGLSPWWGLLVLPYLIGLSASLWGPGSPRWVLMLGAVVGLWYLAIPALVVLRGGQPRGDMGLAPLVVIGVVGLATVGACIGQLSRRSKTAVTG
jgi:hypothetical protein